MPRLVSPKVFIIAETVINKDQVNAYLNSLGAEGWLTDAPSDIEELVEIAGRGCYRSFGTELNQNLTKVREGNQEYLQNIIKVGHGSVTEHGWVTFGINNVSRVFTAENNRHRVGIAISEASMRFIRLDNLSFNLPHFLTDIAEEPYPIDERYNSIDINSEGENRVDNFNNYEEAKRKQQLSIKRDMLDTIINLYRESENSYKELIDLSAKLEDENNFEELPFNKKKKYTSFARKVIPMGVCTNITWSANIRSLRNIIILRTSRHAEDEIRNVFNQIAKICESRWPNLFKDMNKEYIDGYYEYTANKL